MQPNISNPMQIDNDCNVKKLLSTNFRSNWMRDGLDDMTEDISERFKI